MTYTTQQLQVMSDDCLDLAFYKKFGYSFQVANDIMPLAFERGVSLIKVSDGYIAAKYDLYIDISSHECIEGICADGPQFGDANPLRAIACLLLLMDD